MSFEHCPVTLLGRGCDGAVCIASIAVGSPKVLSLLHP